MPVSRSTPTWGQIADEGHRLRGQVLEQLRRLAARQHAATPRAPMAGRVVAAWELMANPRRCRMAERFGDATAREVAEALADDIHDGVAQCWAVVKENEHEPGTEHLVAELVGAGRWLARLPVWAANHDRLLNELFHPEEAVA